MTGIVRDLTKRLPAGVVWVALLLGLWLWGQGLTEVPRGRPGPPPATWRRPDARP